MRASDFLDSRILLVDDQTENLRALSAVLGAAGYGNVTCLDDSRLVLSTVAELHPDLMVLDLHMPHMDGLAVLDQLPTVISQDEFLPILVLTGDGTAAAKEQALFRGAHDYLSKPLKRSEIQIRVRNLLQRRFLHLQLKTQNAHLEEEVRERTGLAVELAGQRAALARSEAALQQQTKLLQSILDSMGEGVIVADEHGRVLLLNPAAEAMVGAEAKFRPRSEWFEGVYDPNSGAPFPLDELPLDRAIRGETVDGVEMHVRSGQIPQGMFVSVNLRPLKDDSGDTRGGVAVVRDITAAKHAEDLLRRTKEEAERANRAKSEFLSRMSHELRTPLNSILGFAQLLELSEMAAQQEDNVQQILKAGNHLLSLINEVLDLARIEAGRLSVSSEPVPAGAAIAEALELVRPLADRQQIELRADQAIRVTRHLQADQQRLRQILLNLLSNAIKFNHPGGSVRVICEETAEGMLRIAIADTGSGMSPEDLTKLFTPFERLSAAASSIPGTGLGLALSRCLLEAMGGTIGVESTVGVGSRFHIELPLVAHAVEQVEESGPAAAAAAGSDSIRGTVLYIEDNISNLRLVEQILGRFPGVTLLNAMRGEIGLSLAQRQMPDWILLDVHLPDINGEEVLRRLQADPSTRHIPVTVLSADATRDQIHNLMSAGAREYLTKPLDVRHLIALLEKTLGEGDTRKENMAAAATPAALPDGLLLRLRAAIRNGEKSRLDELIVEAAGEDEGFARSLKVLADKYDYDGLTHLLAGARP